MVLAVVDRRQKIMQRVSRHGLLTLLLVAARCAVGAQYAERELIGDNQFRRGFTLFETKPGQHIRYGEVDGFQKHSKPVWSLLQWSSKFPLDLSALRKTDSTITCSNVAKTVTIFRTSRNSADLSLSVNSMPEYGEHARKAGEPWVHLLVEQTFDRPPALTNLCAARLHVEARLLRSTNLHRSNYSPETHAAQFQIFFIVQNRDRQSRSYGDMVWFGVPIYDNRRRFPGSFKAQDFGGTEKFIFTPAGETFTTNSAHGGRWIVIEKDLLPLMQEAVNAAFAADLVKSKDLGEYRISGMNMGWELPGTFDVEMQIQKLSLKVSERLP